MWNLRAGLGPATQERREAEGGVRASATAPATAVWRRRRTRTTKREKEEQRWSENAEKGDASKSFADETKMPENRAVPPKDRSEGPLSGNINQIPELKGEDLQFSVTTRATRRGTA